MAHFADSIIEWYSNHQRDLPWRNTKNPYFIWLSEVILQQTRVNQGLNYYLKFMTLFPAVSDLAAAPEDLVLKTWEGLGYYSRARNLHAAAKHIVQYHNGVFPTTYQDILALKGVGEYTAAAIASFAFDLPYAVLDGNVQRVISRYFGILTPIDTSEGRKEITFALESVFDSERPALFNQAIMEFGALQCVPAHPNCETCPLMLHCEAYQKRKVAALPIKSKKTKIRPRYFYYLLPENGDAVYIHKRQENDIWNGLYEFPLIEASENLSFSDLEQQILEDFHAAIRAVSPSKKHVLSHQHIFISFVKVHFEKEPTAHQMVKLSKIDAFPFPIVLANYLKKELKQ